MIEYGGPDIRKEAFHRHPPLVKGAIFVLLLYGIANFLACLHILSGNSPNIINGQMVLHSHGTIARQLQECVERRERCLLYIGTTRARDWCALTRVSR